MKDEGKQKAGQPRLHPSAFILHPYFCPFLFTDSVVKTGLARRHVGVLDSARRARPCSQPLWTHTATRPYASRCCPATRTRRAPSSAASFSATLTSPARSKPTAGQASSASPPSPCARP